jgi:hypothetical protein
VEKANAIWNTPVIPYTNTYHQVRTRTHFSCGPQYIPSPTGREPTWRPCKEFPLKSRSRVKPFATCSMQLPHLHVTGIMHDCIWHLRIICSTTYTVPNHNFPISHPKLSDIKRHEAGKWTKHLRCVEPHFHSPLHGQQRCYKQRRLYYISIFKTGHIYI